MKLPKSSGGESAFELTPDGNHLAVCFQVIDLGTHKIVYKDNEKEQRKVIIGWELPHERMSDGRPFMVKKRYTFSSNEKATMRRDLESWRGKKFQDSDFGPNGFDIRNLLGKGCFLQVVHNDVGDKTYANINSIGSLPKGTTTPELENAPVYLSLDEEDYDPAVFADLPEWMQELIAESPEYKQLHSNSPPEDYRQPAAAVDPADESPF
jgi:hypothetical protein